MILSQPDLEEAIKKGEIKFDPPLAAGQIRPASIDLRLGYNFFEPRKVPQIAVRHGLANLTDDAFWAEKNLESAEPFASYILEPGEFVLAQTLEHIYMPNHLAAMVEGRSSYARVGLSMHQTAPWIQPGWNGQITLEIRNSGPWNVDLMPESDKLCQLTFMQLTKPLTKDTQYGARPEEQFQNQTDVLGRN